MAVGVRTSESQRTGGPSQRELQPVVVGIRHVLQREDLTKAGSKLPEAVGIGEVLTRRAKTRRLEVDEVRVRVVPDSSTGVGWRYKSETRAVVRIAYGAGNRLTGRKTIRSKWVVSRDCRNQLVGLEFCSEMGSL